jgi:hypothetical protein
VPETNPWTRRFRLSWPESVRYFERRFSVLRRFEDQGLLRQLRVDEDRVSVRLGDANHVVVYGLRSLEGGLLQPDSDQERLQAALEVIFEELQPSRLLRPQISFQWLVSLDRDYDEARKTTAVAAWGDAGEPLFDWSALVDGKLERPNLSYRAEFGIVDAAEAPQRLSRQAGHVTTPDRESPPTLWPVESLPDVAWFYDTICALQDAPPPTAEGVFTLMKDTYSAAERLMSAMMKKFVPNGAVAPSQINDE